MDSTNSVYRRGAKYSARKENGIAKPQSGDCDQDGEYGQSRVGGREPRLQQSGVLRQRDRPAASVPDGDLGGGGTTAPLPTPCALGAPTRRRADAPERALAQNTRHARCTARGGPSRTDQAHPPADFHPTTVPACPWRAQEGFGLILNFLPACI